MSKTWPTGTDSCFGFLRAVPILEALDESALWQLATCSDSVVFEPGEFVMDEGDVSDSFYIVRAGQALVFKRDRAGVKNVCARLACGSYFGELGLLTNSPRTASIRVSAHAPLVAYRFEAQTFHSIVADHVLLFRMRRQRRAMARRTVTGTFDLKNVPFLQELSPSELAALEAGSTTDTWAAGETIFEQGDRADRFYVVVDGGVDVEIDYAHVASLSGGDFFGETALLLDSPRTATVRSGDRGAVTWSISRRAFQHIVGHYLLRDANARGVVIGRIAPKA